jgi:hypothetical protein
VEYDREGASKSFFGNASIGIIGRAVTSFSNSFDNFSRDNSVEIHNSVESKFRRTGMEHGNWVTIDRCPPPDITINQELIKRAATVQLDDVKYVPGYYNRGGFFIYSGANIPHRELRPYNPEGSYEHLEKVRIFADFSQKHRTNGDDFTGKEIKQALDKYNRICDSLTTDKIISYPDFAEFKNANKLLILEA